MSDADNRTLSPDGKTAPNNLPSILMIRLVIQMFRAGTPVRRRQFDLSESEWRTVIQLGVSAPLSLNGLADALYLDRGQLSRTVKTLVERGILTRDRKPGGPEIEINLSEEGRALYQEMVVWVIERDRSLMHGIDPDDIAAFLRVIEIMANRTAAQLEEELARV